MRAACCAFAISPLCSWRLSLAFLCVVGRQLRKPHAPVALVAVPYPPPAQAAIVCRSAVLQVPSFGSSLVSTTPPPSIKKKSILSYYSACAVAPPGKCPLGTRFLHRFRTRWHIAQAPDRNFALVRILSISNLQNFPSRARLRRAQTRGLAC